MIKSYKYRLYPNNRQVDLFEKTFGCVRYVYNWSLDKRIKQYKENGSNLSWVDICNDLVLLKKQDDKKWLNEVYSKCLQMAIRNMDCAFKKFWKKECKFPKFHSKRQNYQSFQLVDGVRIDFNCKRVKLPKVGYVKFAKNMTFNGKIKTSTVSKSSTNKYYISIVVDDGIQSSEKPEIQYNNSIGIDVGLKDYAVLSNGLVFKNPRYLESNLNRIKILSKRLSRKQKHSKRREKARLALAKKLEQIKNKKLDYTHKITSKIISENQTIIIEDLNIKAMLKNKNLSQHIYSVGWGEFFRQLQYKCDWYGKNFIKINRFDPSSKMCLCGYINKSLTLNDREWTCACCGRHNDRDLLAAINIKRFGLKKIGYIKELTPYVVGEVDVEYSTLVDAMKRQSIEIV